MTRHFCDRCGNPLDDKSMLNATLSISSSLSIKEGIFSIHISASKEVIESYEENKNKKVDRPAEICRDCIAIIISKRKPIDLVENK